ncbi:MAG TPA: hypothetical protein VEC16_03200 [Alphaproteobacteria bacterium]|nr:hypothetical protein [Alphaproteobacteria bacterium]
MNEVYIALFRLNTQAGMKHYILANEDASIMSDTNLSRAIASFAHGWDMDPNKSIIDCVKYNMSLIKTDMDYVYENLIDEDKDWELEKIIDTDIHIFECNGKGNIKDIFDKGLQPCHLRILAYDAIKQLQREYMPK